ncbi:hypothetical protein HGB13_04180 [bacterium]|nr:hypothetical protein [bacterium]
MKLKNFQKIVEDTLREYPKTRDDDTFLTWHIVHLYRPECCSEHNGDYWINYKGMKLVREDHVKRIRAKIQNDDGKYLPTDPKVRKQRKISEETWRNYLAKTT